MKQPSEKFVAANGKLLSLKLNKTNYSYAFFFFLLENILQQ